MWRADENRSVMTKLHSQAAFFALQGREDLLQQTPFRSWVQFSTSAELHVLYVYLTVKFHFPHVQRKRNYSAPTKFRSLHLPQTKWELVKQKQKTNAIWQVVSVETDYFEPSIKVKICAENAFKYIL